ncbi:MAG: RNA polymerase-binding protein DksA [Rickettsiales bacterium]|jgi:DnaK suppressor protein|nr:RNA polymerase-binding protein DksA [Rickettsiales bacterium]
MDDYKTLALEPGYKPRLTEPYMCLEQKAYFYQLLNAEKAELIEEESELRNTMRDNDDAPGDLEDAADKDMTLNMEIKIANRDSNMIQFIDAALKRLEDGTYGYSEISGDEIGLKRLMVRPIARITIAEQEAKEKQER